jgi:SAM-dependent methyltransferase
LSKTAHIEQLNKEAWENVTNTFSLYRDSLNVTPFFINFMEQLPAHSSVLDLGCGTGLPFGKYIADKNHILRGVDFSENMIELAKKNVPEKFKEVISLCSIALKKGGLMYLSLNEPVIIRNDYTIFMGERMFFKDYSESDLVDIFLEYGLIKTDLQRSVEDSETFGKEYMIEIIFEKKTGRNLLRPLNSTILSFLHC